MQRLRNCRSLEGFLTLAVLILLISCHSSPWDELPSKISTFVSTYYPLSTIESYTEGHGQSVLRIKNGATITFDASEEWTSVDGNGSTLPAIFVTDCLPAPLVDYITALGATGTVYKATDTALAATATLTDFTVTYDKVTGKVTQN